MAVILNLDWELYEEGKRCPSYGDYKGLLKSVDSCGSACKGVASMFIYCSRKHCICETSATTEGTCEVKDSNYCTLYKYISGILKIAFIFDVDIYLTAYQFICSV